MRITPVNPEWIHNQLMRPYLEGCTRLNLCWSGVRPSVSYTPIPLKNRIIYLMQGFFLLLPLINTIIWLCWKRFGSPTILSEPFCPEGPTPLRMFPKPIQVEKIPENQIKLPEHFSYESKDKKIVECSIQYFPQKCIVKTHSPLSSSTSICTHSLEIEEYHAKEGAASIGIEKKRKWLHVTLNENEIIRQKVLEQEKNLPWIQQPEIGLRPFVLSPQIVLDFYEVVTQRILNHAPPFLMENTARKIGKEKIEGLGELIKIEVKSNWSFPFNAVKHTLWFDSQGVLKKTVQSFTK